MIENYRLKDNVIICNIDIVIELQDFCYFLQNNDLLYYETHDCTTGQMVSDCRQISIDEYFATNDHQLIINDLNDFYNEKKLLIMSKGILKRKKPMNSVLWNFIVANTRPARTSKIIKQTIPIEEFKLIKKLLENENNSNTF